MYSLEKKNTRWSLVESLSSYVKNVRHLNLSSARAIFRLCSATAAVYSLKIRILFNLLSNIGNCSTSVKNYFRGNIFYFENTEKYISHTLSHFITVLITFHSAAQ